MKKFFIVTCFFSICLIFIFLIYKFIIPEVDNNNSISINNRVEENIVNDVNETALETSSEEKKISHSATIILNKYYKKCKHTITSSVDVPYDMINLTKEELEKQYAGWRIVEFSENKISLFKEFDGICNEHYLVRS